MPSLAQYFSDRALVQFLCRRRIEAAVSNRREHFLSSAALDTAHRWKDTDLQRLLPPRRQWPRLDKRGRAVGGHAAQAARASLLASYVLTRLAKAPNAAWVYRLRAFIDKVRHDAVNWNRARSFPYRRLAAIPKDKPGSGRKYRLLTIYGLEEAAIAHGFSNYLRERLEPMLGEHCLAFRARQPDGRSLKHHDGIRVVWQYAASRGSTNSAAALFVAECDIRGFFDQIRHSVLRRQLMHVLKKNAQPHDELLVEFAESFLNSYTFSHARASAVQALATQHIHGPKIGEAATTAARIGIPQGSAFSCVLANVVLLAADRALQRNHDYKDALYVRYCDDIVILHPARTACDRLLQVYLDALGRLKLPAHPPVRVGRYGRKFWQGKSKWAYKWADDGKPRSVPWFSFVGYQLRRNGAIRARSSSILKEVAKQRRVVNHILGRLEQKGHSGGHVVSRNLPSVLFRARMHMSAFGVGYPAPFTVIPKPDGLCWTNGFVTLRELGPLKQNIAALDRGRSTAISRIVGRLLGLKDTGKLTFMTAKTNKKLPGHIDYLGWPLCYWRQFVEF